MRLKALTMKNFKGVDERGIRIELAPITLLFGPNNVGKSTVIQALHLAREVFHGGLPDKIEASRHGVELGTFKDYVHRHELDRVVQIGFSFDTEADSLFVGKRVGVEVSICWNKRLVRAEVAEYAVLIHDKKIAAWSKTAPLEAPGSGNAAKAQAESYLCVYDTTPLISDADMGRLTARRDVLLPRLAETESIEQARLVFKSVEWAGLLKSYFEAIPEGLHSVSNVNAFLRHLGIGTEFLNHAGIDELYEKSMYTMEAATPDFADLFKRLGEDFPDDAGFINDLVGKFSNPNDVFSHLVIHFQDDFDSLKRLCEYAPGTYPYFADYYADMDIGVDEIRKRWKLSFYEEENMPF